MIKPIPRIEHLVKYLDMITPKLIQEEIDLEINEELLRGHELSGTPEEALTALRTVVDQSKQKIEIMRKEVARGSELYMDELEKLDKINP